MVDFLPTENPTFLDLDPLQLGIYAFIILIEAFGMVLIAMAIKYKIRWGKLYLERYIGAWFLCSAVYTVIIVYLEAWEVLAFTLGAVIGMLLYGVFFNIINKDVRMIYFETYDIPNNWKSLKKFMCYQESSDERVWVAIRLDENGRESFRDLFKRTFGIKKRIRIMNRGTPFNCNENALSYIYREFRLDTETGEYQYAIEPNVRHTDVGFLKAYDGFWSQKTEIDTLNDEIVKYQMLMYELARKFSNNINAPLIKFLYGKQYPSFLRLKIFRDAEADLRIKEIEKELKEKHAEEEKEFKKSVKVDEKKGEFVSDEYEYRLA